MNVVDSSCWLEYFADGPNAERFAAPIRDTDALVVPTIVVLEVFKRVLQQRDEGAALRAAAYLARGRLIGLDSALAVQAARLGTELKLPLADSVIYATARASGATLWTQDAHFQALPEVRYFPRT
jgi:predicted nucleic acid-binding protein